MLRLRWDCDKVVVSFGEREIDITLAAVAALELGRESEALWDEHLERIKRENPSPDPPPTDDGIERMLAVTMGVSTTIGGEDEGHVKHTGILLGVQVREVEKRRLRAGVAGFARRGRLRAVVQLDPAT